MKNVLSSFILLVIMLIFMFFSVKYLGKTCYTLTSDASTLEAQISKESWDKAYKTSLKFMKDWKEDSKLVSIFVHHQEIDDINNEVWKLTQHVKCENKDEALASIHAIKFLISHIIDLEKINIQNLL